MTGNRQGNSNLAMMKTTLIIVHCFFTYNRYIAIFFTQTLSQAVDELKFFPNEFDSDILAFMDFIKIGEPSQWVDYKCRVVATLCT